MDVDRLTIRPERPGDEDAVRALVYDAFLNHPQHEPGAAPTEHRIVDELRETGALALALVAEADGQVVGHIAFSPVLVTGASCDWFGLGPRAVARGRQREGIGSALIRAGLEILRKRGAQGVALVGDPEYYGRFGFREHQGLVMEGVPPQYCLARPFDLEAPQGTITYSPAFFSAAASPRPDQETLPQRAQANRCAISQPPPFAHVAPAAGLREAAAGSPRRTSPPQADVPGAHRRPPAQGSRVPSATSRSASSR